MIPALMGLPAKAKAIYDHLTTYLSSTRAAKIDNLDAAVTTRAAASTALSNATWTNALATAIGATNAAIGALSAPTVAGQAPGTMSTGIGYGSGNDLRAGICGALATGTWATLTDVVSVSGKGVLNFAAYSVNTNYTPSATVFEVVIDGVSIGAMTSANSYFAPGAGAISPSGGVALDQIPFLSSLVIRVRAGGNNAALAYKYRRTA